jgi:SAM-dependent methyltransferase
MMRNALTEIADRMGAREEIAEIHGYFRSHRTRLTSTLDFFKLWELTEKRILEIGPFFAYTPFLFRQQGNEVVVLEGTDPVIAPLLKPYQEAGIRCDQINLLRIFTREDREKARLPYEDGSFDTFICFETMEHLNFNPVPFVREVHRILAPGGLAFITVPNLAKLDFRIRLMLGRPIRTTIDDYYQFADYNAGEFLGFHWREYLLDEIVELFSRGGFAVETAAHLNSFIDRDDTSLGRHLKRALGKVAIGIWPDMAQNCALVVRKI